MLYKVKFHLHVQSNLPNVDTNGTDPSVCVIEVSEL